ncbi:MAG: hypothetical protein LBD38_02515 [Streptococcaceae bacterium]|jgi:capsular polysaccharide biosynthesis protein|nr:hypothetical protein [Streptococcaceae bacterium]
MGSFKENLEAIKKSWIWILVIVVLFTLAGVFLAKSKTETYYSTKIEYAIKNEATEDAQKESLTVQSSSYVTLLKSRALGEDVSKSLSKEGLTLTAAAVSGTINAVSLPDSNIFEFSVALGSRENVQKLANVVDQDFSKKVTSIWGYNNILRLTKDLNSTTTEVKKSGNIYAIAAGVIGLVVGFVVAILRKK